tara:strand:+ start:863 stop:1432 length:570 start_codon:yes stop_codon:yes gene_type:complete
VEWVDESTEPKKGLTGHGFPSRAIETLYRRYFSEICANIRASFGSGPPEPEDAVQTAFAKYAGLAEEHKVRDPRAFLYIAARNVVLDHRRRAKVSAAYTDEQLAFDKELGLEEITPERVVAAKERFDVLIEAMEKLPEKQRQVLILSRIEGLTYREIGAQTGWSAADISRSMATAMKTLARALGDAGRR